jgi:hypothetical protein
MHKAWRGAAATVMTLGMGIAALAGGAAGAPPAPQWKVVDAPIPPGVDVALDGVSCPTTGSCLAVGGETLAGTLAPVAETFNGSTWTLRHPLNAIAPFGAQLSAVSCFSPTDCTAVGVAYAHEMEEPFAEQWDGRSWRIEKIADALAGDLSAVSCPSATTCVAVGTTDGRPLAEEWTSGIGWSIMSVPPVAPYGASLTGVSCPVAGDCYAVGENGDAYNADQAVVEHLQAGAWDSVYLRPSTGARLLDLLGITCSSTTRCAAVGSPEAETGTLESGYVLALIGTEWHPQILQTNAPAGSRLFAPLAVACPAATTCTAAGGSGRVGGRLVTSADSVVPTVSFSADQVPNPNPAKSYGSFFNGISCPTATDCIAVGQRTPTSGSTSLSVIEQYGS